MLPEPSSQDCQVRQTMAGDDIRGEAAPKHPQIKDRGRDREAPWLLFPSHFLPSISAATGRNCPEPAPREAGKYSPDCRVEQGREGRVSVGNQALSCPQPQSPMSSRSDSDHCKDA